MIVRSDCWGMGVYAVPRWRDKYAEMVQLVHIHDDLAWPADSTPTLMNRPGGGLNLPTESNVDHAAKAKALGKRVIQCIEHARVRNLPDDRWLAGPRAYHRLPGPDARIHPPWDADKRARIVNRTSQHRAEMGLGVEDPIQLMNEIHGDPSSPKLREYEPAQES